MAETAMSSGIYVRMLFAQKKALVEKALEQKKSLSVYVRDVLLKEIEDV